MKSLPVPFPLNLTFDNVLTEHLAAERLYYRSTIFWKIDKAVGAALIGIGIYLIYLVGIVWWSIIWIPLGILEACNLLTLRPIQILLWFKRNPKLRETYHLSFDESGIHFRTASIDSHIKWDHFSRVLENESLWLLIYGSRMYTLIPKRAFSSVVGLEAFKSLVNRKFSDAMHMR